MITIFDNLQRSHAPREFIVSGRPQPIPESPQRIDMLMEGIRRIDGPIVSPPEIFGDTLGLVHDQRYIQFLSTLWERWRRIPDAAANQSQAVFFTKSGMLWGNFSALEVTSAPNPSKQYREHPYAETWLGATRTEDARVVRVITAY